MDPEILSLKVMRLCPPTFASPFGVGLRSVQLDASDVDRRLSAHLSRDYLATNDALILPQSVVPIYLGETFTCYLCLHNNSTEAVCSQVRLTCDLQTSSQRLSLYSNVDKLCQVQPGESVDILLRHDIKEIGSHILSCEGSFDTCEHKGLLFRKFFKFAVDKPLDVATKFHLIHETELLVEAQIENVTSKPMLLEHVTMQLAPLSQLSLADCTAADIKNHIDQTASISDDDDVAFLRSAVGSICNLQIHNNSQSDYSGRERSELDSVVYLEPRDVNHFTFRLNAINDLTIGSNTDIGHLDILWRTGFGDRGRLQTSPLVFQPAKKDPLTGDLRLTVDQCPDVVRVDTIFDMTVTVTNASVELIDVRPKMEVGRQSQMWHGWTVARCGSDQATRDDDQADAIIKPEAKIVLHMSLLFNSAGHQRISGLTFSDKLLDKVYNFTDIHPVLVTV